MFTTYINVRMLFDRYDWGYTTSSFEFFEIATECILETRTIISLELFFCYSDTYFCLTRDDIIDTYFFSSEEVGNILAIPRSIELVGGNIKDTE